MKVNESGTCRNYGCLTRPTMKFFILFFPLVQIFGVTSASRVRTVISISDISAPRAPYHRILSGDNGDNISYDDDFWAYNVNAIPETVWSDYSLMPKKCLIHNKKHMIAFELYGKNNKNCSRKREGLYLMDVSKFARAYVAQKETDYNLSGNGYGNIEAMDYLSCSAAYYNENEYYAQLGCSSTGGLRIISYSDSSCNNEVSVNLGLYNDIKISFSTCYACVYWPANNNGDAQAQDDQFQYYHQYDSKLCSAANHYKQSCGWGCKKKALASTRTSSYSSKHGWNGTDKFFLIALSLSSISLAWLVLKQRRQMTREDAMVEEASLHSVGLKKRHIFPIALFIIFITIFFMFMVWKVLTWMLLVGVHVGLMAHLLLLRRKAKKANAGMSGYVKDEGLQIN